MVLWVESWVSCCKALTQWDVLGEYARSTDNVPLAMDCMWRLHEWEALQGSLVQNKHQVRGEHQGVEGGLLGDRGG